MQPFHFQRGRFVAGTRDVALGLMAEKLGTSPGDFRAVHDRHYRVVREVLMRRLPAPGEGKGGFRSPSDVTPHGPPGLGGALTRGPRWLVGSPAAPCQLGALSEDHISRLLGIAQRLSQSVALAYFNAQADPFKPTNLTGLGTLRAGESQRRSARPSPYARCRGFSESSLRSESCRARC